jgi:hypothetical protein
MFGQQPKMHKVVCVRVDYDDIDLVSEYVILNIRHGAKDRLQDKNLIREKVEEVCRCEGLEYRVTPINLDSLVTNDNLTYFINL